MGRNYRKPKGAKRFADKSDNSMRSVRTMKIELYKFSPERRKKWKELAELVQQATNSLWQLWLAHHVVHGSKAQLREDLKLRREWHENGRKGKQPPWRVERLPEELENSKLSTSTYRVIAAEFSELNFRVRSLLINRWSSLLKSRKAANGDLPGWVSILTAREAIPSFTNPLPIPFDKQNSKFFKDKDGYHVELRLERLPDSGKSVVERADLMLRKRKAARYRVTLERILDGTYEWKGCNLVYKKGKWFIALCYSMPKNHHESLKSDKTLYVWPGRDRAFAVMVAGGDAWNTGGNGHVQRRMRQRLATQRAQRQEHYKWSGSAQRGRGCGRANAVWTKLKSEWNNHVERLNDQCSTNVVRSAVRNRCGRVVYLQPMGDRRERRTLGRDETGRGMTWQFEQFGTKLQRKCDHEGIQCEVKQVSTGKVKPNADEHAA